MVGDATDEVVDAVPVASVDAGEKLTGVECATPLTMTVAETAGIETETEGGGPLHIFSCSGNWYSGMRPSISACVKTLAQTAAILA